MTAGVADRAMSQSLALKHRGQKCERGAEAATAGGAKPWGPGGEPQGHIELLGAQAALGLGLRLASRVF